MNTKIKVTINNDYDSDLAYNIRNEDIRYLLTELDIYCEVSNNSFINIVQELQTTITYNCKSDYKDKLIVNATGYSQGDWQEYILYYNKKETNKGYLKQLVNLLEKSFTHQNNYIAYTNELVEIENKFYSGENTECFGFCVNEIEFPKSENVIKEFKDQFGIEYDIIECIID